MVWEQRSYSIVMVTSLVELEKVYKYIFTALSFYVLQYWYYISLYCITACIIYVSVLFQPKCEKYWPNKGSKKYGDIEVTLMKIEEFAYHVTHTLQLKKVEKMQSMCFVSDRLPGATEKK